MGPDSEPEKSELRSSWRDLGREKITEKLLRPAVEVAVVAVSWSVAAWFSRRLSVAGIAAERAIKKVPSADKLQRVWTSSSSIWPASYELLQNCVDDARFVSVFKEDLALPLELRGVGDSSTHTVSRITMDSSGGFLGFEPRKGVARPSIDSYQEGSISELCARLEEDSATFVLLLCTHEYLSERVLQRSAGYLTNQPGLAIRFQAIDPFTIRRGLARVVETARQTGATTLAKGGPILLTRNDLLAVLRRRNEGAGELLGEPLRLEHIVSGGLRLQGLLLRKISVSALDFEKCSILLCREGDALEVESSVRGDREHGTYSFEAGAGPRSRPPGTIPKRSRSRRPVSGPLALVILPMSSHPANHGNRRRAVDLGSLLHDFGFETCLAFAPSYGQTSSDTEAMEEFWGEIVELKRIGANASDFERYENLLNNFNANLLWKLSSDRRFDLVLGVYAWTAPLVQHVRGKPHKILDAQDVLSNRWDYMRNMGLEPSFFNLRPQQERDFVSTFDEVWAISRAEKEVLDQYETGTPVFHMPPMLHPVRGKERQVDGTIRFGIVASDNPINTASVIDLLEALQTLPPRPGWELQIGGSVAQAIPGQIRHAIKRRLGSKVKIVGPISELDSFYQGIDVAVSVARGGTGTSMKAVEAVARGKALIANAEGARGLESSVQSHNFESISDVAEAMLSMASAEVELLRHASIEVAEKMLAITRSTSEASLGKWRPK